METLQGLTAHSYRIRIKNIITFVVLTFLLFFGLNISSGNAYGVKQTTKQPVPLGALAKLSLFSNKAMCNSGNSLISGDVYVNEDTTSLLGISLPIGLSINGLVKIADTLTAKAKVDLDSAITNASNRTGINLGTNLSGKVLTPGVYGGTSLSLNGKLTLDAKNDPNAVFILKTNGNLNIAANSGVTLINGANSDRVFWIVGGKAYIGVKVIFIGKLLSLGDIDVTNAKVHGALFSRNGRVCLDTSVVTTPAVVGATMDVGLPQVPPPAVAEVPETTVPTVENTTPPTEDDGPEVGGISEAGADTSSTSLGSQIKGSSGILAFTGRNALWLTAIALMLVGAGSGIYYQMKHRQLKRSDN